MCKQGDEEEVARGRQGCVEEGSWGEGALHAIESAREQRRLQEERNSRRTQESSGNGLADVQRRWLAEEGSREVCYPLILHLVDFSVSRQSIEQVHLFVIRIQKSTNIFLGLCSELFVNTCSYPLGEIVKNVLAFNFL